MRSGVREKLERAAYELAVGGSSHAKEITQAISVGVGAARDLIRRHGELLPAEMADRLGARVVVEERERGAVGSVLIPSAYEPDPPTIRLFSDALEKMEALLRSVGLDAAFPDLAAISITHELFHHLERTHQVTTPTPEVSAHAFSKELLRLEWSPVVIGVLIAGETEPAPAWGIEQRLQKVLAKHGQMC